MFCRCRTSVALVLLMGAIYVYADPATQPTTRATIANATTRPTSENQIAAWFTELANRDSSRRDAARQNLMGLSRADLPTLRAIVQKNHPLAPSQAAALRDIVTQVFLSGETYNPVPQHAFLGVTYQGYVPGAPADIDDGNPQAGVVVTDRIPGFPAYRALQNGDVIMGATEMGDDIISRTDELQGLINTYHDGDTIHLKILRAGQTIIVPVKLCAHPDWDTHQFLDIRQVPEVRKRQLKADDYWDANFAQFIDDSVS